MIEYVQGNILCADTEAYVNTVNCVGVMGRGIALQFKKAFPDNFAEYAIACERKEVVPGRMFVHDAGELSRPRWIINFPTKRHWRGKSRLEDIQAGLESLVTELERRGIRSVAIPPLGAGLGGLDWDVVRPLIDSALAEKPNMRVLVYEPGRTASHAIHTGEAPPPMTPGRAALIGLARRYLAGMMDTSISLLEIYKLMYLLQTAGEPLRLRYKKGPYGPYADNLRHVMRAVDGHYLSGFGDGGEAPDKEISVLPGAFEDAETLLQKHPETLQRFDRVDRLVAGFETPFGLELLTTAHWIMAERQTDDPQQVIAGFRDWGPTKARFTDRQITLAIEHLTTSGWAVEHAA